MKTQIGILLSALLSVSALAQGTIIFQNSSSQLVQIANPNAQPVPVGTHIAFYYSPTSGTDPLAMHLIAGGVGTCVAPGRFILGTKTTDTDAAPGSTIYASLRAWTGNYATWDAALAAVQGGAQVIMGSSYVFSMGTGNATSPVALSSVSAFTGFVMLPEPTTSALAVMCVGMVLTGRRFLRRGGS